MKSIGVRKDKANQFEPLYSPMIDSKKSIDTFVPNLGEILGIIFLVWYY